MDATELSRIDALVAEKVMGWTRGKARGAGFAEHMPLLEFWFKDGNPRLLVDTWRPSTKANHAFAVQAQMELKGFWMELASPTDASHESHGGKLWRASFMRHLTTDWNGRSGWLGYGKTPEEAICLAALKAVGHED